MNCSSITSDASSTCRPTAPISLIPDNWPENTPTIQFNHGGGCSTKSGQLCRHRNKISKNSWRKKERVNLLRQRLCRRVALWKFYNRLKQWSWSNSSKLTWNYSSPKIPSVSHLPSPAFGPQNQQPLKQWPKPVNCWFVAVTTFWKMRQ